jgi:hypothetical protein
MIEFIRAQVEDCGRRIPPDPAGKYRKSLELEAVFRSEIVRIFFWWIPVNFLCGFPMK